MKQLICELCEGHEFKKEDGFFVCQSCGMKYSLEEAKKLMDNSPQSNATTSSNQPTQVSTTPTSSIIDNYLHLANIALNAKNYAEAEQYAAKILEIASDTPEAWMIKGKAAGWQSTIANLRFGECVNAFIQAHQLLSLEEQVKLWPIIQDEITLLASALIQTRAERFINWPDQEEVGGFVDDIKRIVETIKKLLTNNIIVNYKKIFEPLPEIIREGVQQALKKTILPDYSVKFPMEHHFNKYVARLLASILLIENSISTFQERQKSDIIKDHELIVVLCQHLFEAKVYDWKYMTNSTEASVYKSHGFIIDYNNSRAYYVSSVLSDQYKSNYTAKMEASKSMITSLKAEVLREEAEKAKQLRIQKNTEDFWVRNASQKKELQTVLEQANERLNLLESEQSEPMLQSILRSFIKKTKAILDAPRPSSCFNQTETDFLQSISTFFTKLDAMPDQVATLRNARSKAKDILTSLQFKSNAIMQRQALRGFIDEIETLLTVTQNEGRLFKSTEYIFIKNLDDFFKQLDTMSDEEKKLLNALTLAKNTLSQLQSTQSGKIRQKFLDGFIKKIEIILNQERTTSSFSNTQILFIQNLNSFFKQLDSIAEIEQKLQNALTIAVEKRNSYKSDESKELTSLTLDQFIINVEGILHKARYELEFTPSELDFLNNMDNFFDELVILSEQEEKLYGALSQSQRKLDELQANKIGKTQQAGLKRFILQIQDIYNQTRISRQFEPKTIAFIQSIPSFNEQLDDLAKYDAYLEQYQIVESITQLQQDAHKISTAAALKHKHKVIISDRISTIFTGFYSCIAILLNILVFYSFGGVGILSLAASIILFVFLYSRNILDFVPSSFKEKITNKKSYKTLKKQIVSYNHAVEQLRKLPPFHGNLWELPPVSIPNLFNKEQIALMLGKKVKAIQPSAATTQIPSSSKTTSFSTANNGVLTIDNVMYITKSAYISTGVKSLKIAGEVRKIGLSAFANSKDLTDINILCDVHTIEHYAFFNCINLTSVSLPASITTIGENVFGNCPNLKDIYYLGTRQQWSSISKHKSWDGDSSAYTLHCSDDFIRVEDSTQTTATQEPALESSERSEVLHVDEDDINNGRIDGFGIKKIIISPQVQRIKPSVFASFKTLTVAIMGEGVVSIEKSAFENCIEMQRIDLNKGLLSISSNAFGNCANLSDIFYNGTLAEWANVWKAKDWDIGTGSYTIHCTDGVLYKEGDIPPALESKI